MMATRWQNVQLYICTECEQSNAKAWHLGTEPCPRCRKPSRLRNEGDTCQCSSSDIASFVVEANLM